MSHKLELLPWEGLSFHWLTCRINDPNYCVFLSNHVLHFGCEGLWHRGRHLTCLPFGTGMSSLAIGQHPRVQLFFFFLATFLFKPKGMSMRSPFCSHPAPSPFNIYLCNRSEKSKCPSQGTPRANTVVHCMPDGLQHPPPIMHTRPSHHHQHHTTPRTDKAEPQLTVSKWVSECEQANEHTPAAVSDLGLNTQTQSVYTVWHLRQLFLIEYCGIGSDKRKLIHVSREPVTTLFTVDLSGELY